MPCALISEENTRAQDRSRTFGARAKEAGRIASKTPERGRGGVGRGSTVRQRDYEQSLRMDQSVYGECTAHPDIATSLGRLGDAWGELGDLERSIDYLEQSLQMRRRIYGESTAHPDIAHTLNNLGKTWSELGDYRKAIIYHEQSLQMRLDIFGERIAHPDIAASLNNLGIAWSDLGDHKKAISFHEQ